MAVATAPTLVYEGLPEPSIRELQQLHEQEGAIRPERVVEVATDPENPLHEHFEWDDTEAARQHRLNQARQVIRSVRVYASDNPAVQVRAYVSLGADHGRAYQRTEEVVSNRITLEQLRRSLALDLARIQRKMRMIEEFADIATSLDGAIEAMRQ